MNHKILIWGIVSILVFVGVLMVLLIVASDDPHDDER